MLRRSKNHRETLPEISGGAKFDVDDIETSMASAENLRDRRCNRAPALPRARIGHRYLAPDDFSPFALPIAPAEQESPRKRSGNLRRSKVDVGHIEKSMASAEICSIGAENSASAPARAHIGHRYRAPDDLARFALPIAPAEQESPRKRYGNLRRSKVDVGDIDPIICRAKVPMAQARNARRQHITRGAALEFEPSDGVVYRVSGTETVAGRSRAQTRYSRKGAHSRVAPRQWCGELFRFDVLFLH